MATPLSNAIPITEADVWRGGGRLLIANTVSPPTFPTLLEDIIDLTSLAIETGWNDVGAVSDDGFELSRTNDVDEGIPIDQRGYNILDGRVSNTQMQLTYTTLDTSVNNMVRIWELGTVTSVAASVGVNVAQKRINIDAPSTLTERMVCLLQQHEKTGKMRAICFRRSKNLESGSFKVATKDPSAVDVTLGISADPSITTGTAFGIMLYQD